MKRPRWFIFLSLFFAYLTVAGIVTGILGMTPFGSIHVLISFAYGLSALAVAIGLWLFRPWAFHAAIISSLSILLRLFQYQYGMNARYTLPLEGFIGYTVLIVALLVLMLYYIKKKLKDVPFHENTKKISALITTVAVLLLVCVVILFVSSVYQASKERKARDTAKTGLTYLEKGDLENAFKYFNQSTIIDPEFSAGYTGKAWVYGDQKKYDLAIENYRKAIKLKKAPDKYYDNLCYRDLGAVLLKKGDLEEGHKMLLTALEIDPNDSKTHFIIAQTFCHRKQNKQAWEHIQKAHELKEEIPPELLNEMHLACGNPQF
jgi:Tfp pilus assembly protein PilF